MNKTIVTTVTLMLFLSVTESVQSQKISWSTSNGFSNTIITIQNTNNQKTRLNNALSYFSTTHATTKQLQDACFYMNSDQEKYDLCLAAYPNIIDKDNFINIYDYFSSFSSALKLYQKTQGRDEVLSVQYNCRLNVEQDMNTRFDLLIHQGDVFLSVNKLDEAITAYLQAKAIKPNDPTPGMKIEEVRRLQKELININNQNSQDNAKFNALIQQGDHLLAYNLFDEAISFYRQAMAIKQGDQTAYARIKEANRRKQGYNINTQDDDIEIEETIEVVQTSCATEESKFSHIMTAIEDQSFSSDQKDMAKKQISKNCMSIDQFKKIVTLFSMDDDRLEMLKFIYDHTEHTDKMYTLRDLLTFSSTKKEFDEFLIDKE